MAFELDTTRTLDRLGVLRNRLWIDDERLNAYYNGTHRLAQMGLAVPPSLRSFETVVNWPRLTIDGARSPLGREDVLCVGRFEG